MRLVEYSDGIMKLVYRSVVIVAVALACAVGSLSDPAQAAGSNPDSSAISLRIHEASADERPDYAPIDIELPDGTTETFWVGDPVMTVTPDEVQKLTVEMDNSGEPRFIAHVDAETEREFTSVTREAKGGHLAFSLGGKIIMVPQVFEPIAGGRITLFRVPGDLLARFTAEVWENLGE